MQPATTIESRPQKTRLLRRLYLRMRRPRAWISLLILLILLALAAPQLIALYSWRAAEQALANHRARDAARHLERCLVVWPRSATGHLRAARAARLLDDEDGASRHLLECQRLEKRPSDESAFEWVLLQAQLGNLDREREAYLVTVARSGSPKADLALEALAAGYLRIYRIYEGMYSLEQLLDHDPENLRALYLRGRAWENMRAYPKAIADYQEVVTRDPENDDARLRLANSELENGQPADALPELEHLRRRQPDNPEVLVRLAFAQNAMGQLQSALELIDHLLAHHPDLPAALSARGQLAFQADQPAEAEYWLRRAIAVSPYDRRAHYFLQQSLEQQGKRQEAEAQKKELSRVEQTIDRLLTITNQLLPHKPRDPGLQCELAGLLMQLGKEDLAVGWYQNALKEDSRYVPALEALADYCERIGNRQEAVIYRQQAEQSRKK